MESTKQSTNKYWLFKPGNKIAPGGRRPGAGRKTAEQIAAKESLREAIARLRQEYALDIASWYVHQAKKDSATMRHLVDFDKPPETRHDIGPLTINLISYNGHNDTAPVQAVAVSAPILAGDAVGQEEGGTVLASPERQRQDVSQLGYSFNVSTSGHLLPPVPDVQSGQEGNLGRNGRGRPRTGSLPKAAGKKQK